MPVSPNMSKGQLGASIAMQFWSFVDVSNLPNHYFFLVNCAKKTIASTKIDDHKSTVANQSDENSV